jgi:hypothetical protein
MKSRALHSELLTALLSRFSSRNEFLRVEMGRVERHFLLFSEILVKGYYQNSQKQKVRKNAIFCDFFTIFRYFRVSFRVGTSFRESGRVR